MSASTHAAVLNGERFSKIIITATGIAVTKKINEKIVQKSSPGRIDVTFCYTVLNFIKIQVKNNFKVKFV